MPKILDDMSGKLLAEARRQLLKEGYQALTIRSAAAACGIGVGTVYNYFPSKDALVAAVLLEDWQACLARIADAGKASAGDTLDAIYRELRDFHDRYTGQLRTTGPAPASYRQYHTVLRSQLAQLLLPHSPDEFTARFAAEAMLTWTMEGIPPEQLRQVIGRIFPET